MAADPLLALGCAWVLWCGAHSLLAHPTVKASARRLLGRWQGYYRLLYNLLALASLLPVLLLYRQAAGPALLVWPDWLWPLPWVMRGLALWLLLLGARAYDMRRFLGFAALARWSGEEKETADPLVMTGILQYLRHPWYLAGLLLLWGRDLAARDLVTAILLSGYLFLGSVLEERRLVEKFGDRYRRYQRQVPRFLPRCRRHE
jgi:protein-S-isoprenylcysteine O-methyltransferase Ste14